MQTAAEADITKDDRSINFATMCEYLIHLLKDVGVLGSAARQRRILFHTGIKSFAGLSLSYVNPEPVSQHLGGK